MSGSSGAVPSLLAQRSLSHLLVFWTARCLLVSLCFPHSPSCAVSPAQSLRVPRCTDGVVGWVCRTGHELVTACGALGKAEVPHQSPAGGRSLCPLGASAPTMPLGVVPAWVGIGTPLPHTCGVLPGCPPHPEALWYLHINGLRSARRGGGGNGRGPNLAHSSKRQRSAGFCGAFRCWARQGLGGGWWFLASWDLCLPRAPGSWGRSQGSAF